jgi:ATP-binding cassette, subfamily G (WHITE), member 2, PDR
MGFACSEQSTTPDFLTSLTSPAERRARPGFENSVPKTPKEFAARWKSSDTYAQLQKQLAAYESSYPIKGEHYQQFLAARRALQSKKL